MTDFVHLHVHTEYSLLDGMSRLDRLVEAVKARGMDAVAMTDHGAMYAAIEFYTLAKSAGIKPIIGMEAYVAPGSRTERDGRGDTSYHLTLLAADDTGYKNLIKLTTEAHLTGYYYKPRIDKDLLTRYSQGLIVLSGCPSGELSRLLLDGNMEGAARLASWYREVFPGRYFIEVQDHGIRELEGLSRAQVELARRLGLPIVATNDVHYVDAADAEAQEILLCIQTNTTLADPKRLRMDGASFYLKSPEEMAALFGEIPDALVNSRRIADMCNLDLELFGRLHLPNLVVPAGEDADTYLARRCWQRLPELYHPVTPEAEERLRYELDVIKETGFSLYMLIVADFVDYARRSGIFFGIRGSAAASIVCYCLGITEIDPISWHLAFDRFLNRERKQMPDIDMDFADDRRDDMIRYVTEKYGRDRVAQIITFGTLGAKAAIRDVGRALGYPLSEVDRIAKLVPGLPVGITIERALHDNPKFREAYEESESVRMLVDKARKLEGIARHASTHAAGVVISADPLTEHVPLQRVVKDSDAVMTQYPMESLEKIGLLKMDFLGLANLTIVGNAIKLIKQTRGIDLDIRSIPLDDPKTFEMLGRGETTSIFQLEGSGMRRYVRELKPTSVADLAAMVALYRPGPMEHIPTYIKAKHGEIPITYPHPALKPILERTYGVIVYQDQVLFIARAIAGYSLGRADILRRAMGKKDPIKMAQERDNFIAGAVANGYSRELAESIFDLIQPFAGYAFNAAHAASYAMLAYQTAYLKANYPVEYMCAVLQSALGSMDKVATAVAEVRRLGIPILPPDINHSGITFTVEEVPDPSHPRGIRFGLAAIKNVGEGPVREIITARERGGPFRDIDDFCARVNFHSANKRVLESLIKAGALDCLARRSQLLQVVDRMMGAADSLQRAQSSGQASLFDLMAGDNKPVFIALPPIPEVDDRTRLAWEKELLGVYLTEHPLQKVAVRLSGTVTAFCGEIDADMAGQKVVVAGMITALRPITAKNGKLMLFATIEDVQGGLELVVFSSVYEETQDIWQMDRIVIVRGRVDVRDDKVQVIVDGAIPYQGAESSPQQVPVQGDLSPDMAPPEDVPEEPLPPWHPRPQARQPSTRANGHGAGKSIPVYHLRITVPKAPTTDALMAQLHALRDTLLRYPGDDRISLCVDYGVGPVRFSLGLKARYCPQLERELQQLLGENALQVERI